MIDAPGMALALSSGPLLDFHRQAKEEHHHTEAPCLYPTSEECRRGHPLMNRHAAERGQLPDAELLAACRRWDPRAWRSLVDRYRRLMYGIPRALGLQPADAEEVFQQTFTALLRSLDRLQDGSRIEAWLVTTSRRASLRLIRDTHRREQAVASAVQDSLADAHPPDQTERILRFVEGERVRRVVESLGDPCRPLLLGLFGDPPQAYRDLARSTGLPIGSVGPLRERCLERLRRRLTQIASAKIRGRRPRVPEAGGAT